MAVNFYDVNFNQNHDGLGGGGVPAISGYILDDDGYTNRVAYEGKVSEGNIISKASATNNIQGAIGMARKQITVNDNTIVCCPLLQGNNIYVIYSDTAAIATIIDDQGTVIESLTLTYNSNSSNLSFIGHFDNNNELDWLSICCTQYDDVTGTIMYIINTTGFSASFTNAMDDYTYLKYKYPYQVVIQKSLSGTNDFQISRFPSEWFNKKIYGTGEGQSQKYSEVVFPASDDTDPFQSMAWYEFSPSHWVNLSNQLLSVKMGAYLEEKGYALGSDILRLNPDGTYTNGVDLDTSKLVFKFGSWNTPYNIDFNGGKIQLYFDGSYKYCRILDSDDNVIDSYQFPYPISGGGSTMDVGATNFGVMSTSSLYLAEYNNHYYLISLRQYYNTIYDDDGNLIKPSGSPSQVFESAFYTIVKVFNNDANNLLYHATEQERIVPANPDELTADETSNQTSDPDNKNEYGNEIPHPKYNEGDWGDGTSDGIRGSGQGQETGGDSEGKLDQQPGLPGKPSIPTPVSTGFMKLYAPTESEIQDLCIELTEDSILTTLKKYFGNNPLDFIVGLQVVPGSYTKDTTKYKIKYGSYASNVSMYPITDEFTTLDYGELKLKEIYGSWEDYNPHTKMSIYLPYIGIKDIDPDKINGTTLKLKYHIDACTGSILAVLTSVRKDGEMVGKEIVVGQWGGQASYTIPLTNTQHDAAVNAVLGVVGATAGIGLAVATGGASALVTAGAVGSVGNALLSGAKSQKTDISMQGSVGGSLAFFTGTDAYIQIEYPKEGRPDDYNHIIGMPSNITTTLAEQPLNNYIEFINVDVSGIDAPTDEKNAIINLLKGGVYT